MDVLAGALGGIECNISAQVTREDLVRKLVDLKPGVYKVLLSEDDGVPEEHRAVLLQDQVAIETCGDGACGVHALFGVPRGHGTKELYKSNARQWACELLGPDLEAVATASILARP